MFVSKRFIYSSPTSIRTIFIKKIEKLHQKNHYSNASTQLYQLIKAQQIPQMPYSASIHHFNSSSHHFIKTSKYSNVPTRHIFTYNRGTMNPYEILGVTKSSTEKEIKLAYFKKAKECHPDMHPNDPKAREKFQKVAEAYEILSDSTRRQSYDTTGYTGQQQSTSQNQQQAQQQAQYTYSSQQHAEDVFRSVSEDADIVKEAIQGLVEDIQDEFTYAAECVQRGDWNEVWRIIKDNKGVILGFVLPVALIFRFPALVLLVGRLALAASQVLLVGLLRQGNLPRVMHWVWKRIVAVAASRTRRRKGGKT